MKYSVKLIAFFCLFGLASHAQKPKEISANDTIFYTPSVGFLVETSKRDSAIGYSLKVAFRKKPEIRNIRFLYSDAPLADYMAFDKKVENKQKDVNAVYEVKEGKYTEWYANGAKKVECYYTDNKLNGEFLHYYPSGELKRKEIWKQGEWQSGKCFDTDGTETEYCSYQELAEYVGGLGALYKFLGENIKYPIEAMAFGIQGTVKLRFNVIEDGSLTDIEVVQSIDKYLDAEALRVVALMPKWKPARMEGKLVKMDFTLPLRFRLE